MPKYNFTSRIRRLNKRQMIINVPKSYHAKIAEDMDQPYRVEVQVKVMYPKKEKKKG